MRKIVSMILTLCLFCGLVSVAGGEHTTGFDTYAHDPVTVQNPVYPQTLSAGELKGNDEQIVQFLARAWYNMLAYETDTLGTDVKKTKAADIYRGIKKGPGVAVFAASDADAVCISALFAFKDRAFWIEFNTDTQTMRYFEWKYPIDKQKKDEGYLTEYTFSSLVAAAVGGNVIIGNYSGSICTAYGTKSKLYKVFDAAYETATGKKNPIK